ncbi:MAG: regulatory protein RecX [Candidatus Omnitrophica bacterium]|nr:regulatory protein RecX [Candidatus Omnitrophota bacterium]
MTDRFRDESARAIAYAYKLLRMRPLSEARLRERLSVRGFSETCITRVVNKLKQGSYVDDRSLATSLLRVQLRHTPSGYASLKEKLLSKGIPEEIAHEALDELRQEYSEYALAKQCVLKKRASIKKGDAADEVRQLTAYLRRRGFEEELINRLIDEFSLGKGSGFHEG